MYGKDNIPKYCKEDKVNGNIPGLEIVSLGKYIPKKCLSNEDMQQFVDTSDEWITSRTGIKSRHFSEGELNAQMAAKAAKKAIMRANIDTGEIACCVVTTFTPDNMTPSVACHVQKLLELPEDIISFDLNGACSGFLYGLTVVRGLLLQSAKKYALLIGSEIISRVVDFADRATCILFGDASAAALIQLKTDAVCCFSLGTRGDTEIIKCSLYPEKSFIQMNGKEVFRFATQIVEECIADLTKKAGIKAADVDYYVCHQANKRIIDHIRMRLKLPEEKFYVNLERYGNTSSASIPLALEEMNNAGLLRRGMKIVCVGFGAGLTWGGVLMDY